MEGLLTLSVPHEEQEWASIDLGDLFGPHPDSLNYASRLARGLPPSTTPPAFPSAALASGLSIDPTTSCTLDTYFMQDMSQMAATVESVTLEFTKSARTLHSPYQLLFERRLAVLQRMSNAIVSIATDIDSKASKSSDASSFRGGTFPALDQHPHILSTLIARPAKTFSLSMKTCVSMLLTMLRAMSATNASLACDVVQRLHKTLAALPPLSGSELSPDVVDGLAAVSKELSGLLQYLLTVLPGQERSVVEVWLRLALIRGSLESMLQIILYLEDPANAQRLRGLRVAPLLRQLRVCRPVPYLGFPSPPPVGECVRFPLPPDLANPCVVSFLVDAKAGWVLVVVPRHGLLKLTIGVRLRAARFRASGDGVKRRLSRRGSGGDGGPRAAGGHGLLAAATHAHNSSASGGGSHAGGASNANAGSGSGGGGGNGPISAPLPPPAIPVSSSSSANPHAPPGGSGGGGGSGSDAVGSGDHNNTSVDTTTTVNTTTTTTSNAPTGERHSGRRDSASGPPPPAPQQPSPTANPTGGGGGDRGAAGGSRGGGATAPAGADSAGGSGSRRSGGGSGTAAAAASGSGGRCNPLQDGGILSAAKLDGKLLLVTCYSGNTSRPGTELWATTPASFEAVVADPSTLDELKRFRVTVQFQPDTTHALPLPSLPTVVTSTTRVVSVSCVGADAGTGGPAGPGGNGNDADPHASSDAVVFLTTFNLCFGAGGSVHVHRVFTLSASHFVGSGWGADGRTTGDSRDSGEPRQGHASSSGGASGFARSSSRCPPAGAAVTRHAGASTLPAVTLLLSAECTLLKHGTLPVTSTGPCREKMYLQLSGAPMRCGAAFPFTTAPWPPVKANAVTIEAWVRLDSLDDSATIYLHGAGRTDVFVDVAPAEAGGASWRCGTRGAGVPGCRSMATQAEAPIGKWTHIAAVFHEASKECRIILNSQQLGSQGLSSDVPHLWGPAESGPALGNGLHGCIAHVKLWSTARTQSLIRHSMHQELRGDETGLVAYWTMHEGCGTVCYDRGPARCHAALLSDPAVPDGGSITLQHVACPDLKLHAPLVSHTDAPLPKFQPVPDTGAFGMTSAGATGGTPATPIHVVSYANKRYIGIAKVPSLEPPSLWAIRYYALATGMVEYERVIRCQGYSFEPHALFYDDHDHKLWSVGITQSEIHIHAGSAGYFPPGDLEARTHAAKLPDLPADDDAVIPAAAVVDHLLCAADLAVLPISQAPLPRTFHPLCVDTSKATVLSLIRLAELHLDATTARPREWYIRSCAVRLLRYNLDSVLACHLDPEVVGFAGKAKAFHACIDGIILQGEVETRIWHLLEVLLERDLHDRDALTLLHPVLRLVLAHPAGRVAVATAWGLRSSNIVNDTAAPEAERRPLTAIERVSFGLLLGHLAQLPNLMVALRTPMPGGGVPVQRRFDIDAAGDHGLLASLGELGEAIPHRLRKSSSFLRKSTTTMFLRSSTGSSLAGGVGMARRAEPSMTSFVVTLLSFLKGALLKRLEVVRQSTTSVPPPPPTGEQGCHVAMLMCFHRSLFALAVREASATNVGPGGVEQEFYPPVTGQLVAYSTELLTAVTRCFEAGAVAVDTHPADTLATWCRIEREMRTSFVGAALPVLVTSLGLLIGTADTALMDIMDTLFDCFTALSGFLTHMPSSMSPRPTGGSGCGDHGHRSKGSLLHTDPLTPSFLQPRLNRRGGANKKGGWDFWTDLQHSLVYVMVRAAGHVSAAAGQSSPAEVPYEKLFSSPLMRAGLSTNAGHRDMSRKARVIQGLLSGSQNEMQMWSRLKKHHLSNPMLGIALQRANDVDRVLRVVYAAVLHHAVPQVDFSTLKTSSSQLPAGVIYGFSKVEGLLSQLLELRQAKGAPVLELVEERALLLLRFDPGGWMPNTRVIEMRMMLAPGILEKYEGASGGAGDGGKPAAVAPPTNAAGDPHHGHPETPAPPAVPQRTAGAHKRLSHASTGSGSGKINNWKKLFLSWKALRRLQQLFKITQSSLDPRANTGQDVAAQIVDVVKDPLVDPDEVDKLLKRRKARGRQRAKGLEHIKRLIQASPDVSCLLDCLLVAVKSISGHHYCQEITAAGGAVEEQVKNAMYSLVIYAVNRLGEMTNAPPAGTGGAVDVVPAPAAGTAPHNGNGNPVPAAVGPCPPPPLPAAAPEKDSGDLEDVARTEGVRDAFPAGDGVLLPKALCFDALQQDAGGGAGRPGQGQAPAPTTTAAAAGAAPGRRRPDSGVEASGEIAAYLIQILGVPWRESDMAFLLSSKLPSLLACMFSVLPPHVAKVGLQHPESGYLPPGLPARDIPLPSNNPLHNVVPITALRAVLEPDAPSCISIASDGLAVRCNPNCSSLRGTVSGSTVWCQSSSAYPKPVFYYEVLVKDLAELGTVAVGLGPSNYDKTRHPGWGSLSCAYHGDDGMLFQGSGRGRQLGPVFGAGHTIGCGLLLSIKEVFWTLDGKLLPVRVGNFSHEVKPLIGIDAKGSFSVNFGNAPFVFDISTMLCFSDRDKQNELRHLAWQLLQSLTLRSTLIILRFSRPQAGVRRSDGQQGAQDTADGMETFEVTPAASATADDTVVFDQVCSPVNDALLKSPRTRDTMHRDQDSMILAAVDPFEAAGQVMTAIVHCAVVEVARCISLWPVAVATEPLRAQLAKCCAILATALHGVKQDSNAASGDMLLSCLVSSSAAYFFLNAAALPKIPKPLSHMLLYTLSLALPGLHPADAVGAFAHPGSLEVCPSPSARGGVGHNHGQVAKVLDTLMESAGRCLPFASGAPPAGCISSGWGALRLLALLARSPLWHRLVVQRLERCLQNEEGRQNLLTSLAVVGGLREQLGTGSLIEYSQETKATKDRVHVVSLHLDDGTVQIVDRALRSVLTLPLSGLALPDPFCWSGGSGSDTPSETPPAPAPSSRGAGGDDRKDLWPVLRELLRKVLSDENGVEHDTALSMMVIRAAWVNVKASPAALRWLATSGLLKHVVALAAGHNKGDLPLEAAEEKVLMLYSRLAEHTADHTPPRSAGDAAPGGSSSPRGGKPGGVVGASYGLAAPLPLRYFATTHTHGSPMLSPSVIAHRPAASDSDSDGDEQNSHRNHHSGRGLDPTDPNGDERDSEGGDTETDSDQDEVEETQEVTSDQDGDEEGDDAGAPPPYANGVGPQTSGSEAAEELEIEYSDDLPHGVGMAIPRRAPQFPVLMDDDVNASSSGVHTSKPDGLDDAGSFTNAADQSGAYGAASPPPDYGLRMYGGMVCFGDPQRLQLSGPMTVEISVRLHSLEGMQTILHRGGADGEAGWFLQVLGSDRIVTGWQDESGKRVESSVPITASVANRWMHLAAVYDGSVWTLYRDGVPDTPSTPPAEGPVAIEYGEWFLGGRGADAATRLHADVKNVRIWQTDLPVSKIDKLAAGHQLGNTGLLLCFFVCKEREGRTVHDSMWIDGVRLTGDIAGKAEWVASDGHGGEIEEELDLTTLNDGDSQNGVSLSTTAHSAHACVDRAALWTDIKKLLRGDMTAELHRAQHVVCCLYARALLLQTLSKWPEALSMPVDLFGGTSAMCQLLRVLVDCGQSDAAEVVKSHLQKMLTDSPAASDMTNTLLGECLSLIEEIPSCIIRESCHPYNRKRKGTRRSIGVPGYTHYRVLMDPRSTEAGPETLIITADPECRRVITRASGPKPWPPLAINLPRFYVHYRTDVGAGGWGYRFIVQYGYERFELGLALLENLVAYCDSTEQLLPNPLKVFHALLSAASFTMSYHRRLLFSVIRQLVRKPLEWPVSHIPDTSVMGPFKQALERQYARELVNRSCVMHSKFVQSLTELFLAIKDAEPIWRRKQLAAEADGIGVTGGSTVGDATQRDLCVPADAASAECEKTEDGRMAFKATGDRQLFKPHCRLASGKWYFEVSATPGKGTITVGVASSEIDSLSRSWGWGFNGEAVTKGQERPPDASSGEHQLVIGVELDMDAGCLSFRTVQPHSSSCTLDLHPQETVNPFFLVEGRETVVINFGEVPFVYPQPPGYRAIRPSHPKDTIPFSQLRALVDTTQCLLHGLALPPYFHDSTDHFKNNPYRIGPQYPELVATDGVISNGLECRNTGTAFHSVKANVKVLRGKWYYEVTLASHGLMQIGWASDRSLMKPVGGLGVGDDDQSWAVDLFRQQKWHQNQPGALAARKWAMWDVIGCMIDLDAPGRGKMSFTINGELLLDEAGSAVLFSDVDAGDGLYPAASFRANNCCTFNFGGSALKRLPKGYNALGVADTWLERIDAYYSSLTPKVPPPPSSTAVAADRAGDALDPPAASKDANQEVTGSSVPPRPNAAVPTMASPSKRFAYPRNVQLVALMNALCKAQKKNLHQVSLDRALWRNVWDSFPLLHGVGDEELLAQLGVLKKFNKIVFTIIPLMNFEMMLKSTSAASVFTGIRGLLFQSVADDILKSVIKTTNGKAEPIRVTLNRRKAARHRQFPELDKTGASSLFGQTYELLGSHPPSMFKTNQRFWSVVFAGEGAEDVGGPFREHITEMCSELMSSACPLFIPSPNQRSGVGTHRDCFVINPSATGPTHLSMFDFLGRLMGGAIRSNEPLSLYLPPVVWKLIVGERVAATDLDCFDHLCYQCVGNISELRSTGVTEDMYNRTLATETFSTLLSDGSMFELIHNGSALNVTFDRLEEYAELVTDARLGEAKAQIRAIRRGLFSVIPEYVFYITTWKDLELRVCGRPDFTVKELKEWTTLDGLSKHDKRVLYLWQVLEEISPSDRRAFLRFVAGRERLPVKLRVMPLFCRGYPDCYLPKAATCFFALELPDYSTVDVMREKLLYAIKNCSDIDTDFRAREFDEDEAPQLVFDELRQEDQEVTGGDSESVGSGEEW